MKHSDTPATSVPTSFHSQEVYLLDANDERALKLGTQLLAIWEDQRAFNTLFREPPTNADEMTSQTRDFVLYTEDELHELLRTTKWKRHRRGTTGDNPAHRMDECADVFKCMLSIFQIQGLTPEVLVDAYWKKTAVVRQRYQEEWVKTLDRPCAIVDIDNVLCDYSCGIVQWMLNEPECRLLVGVERLETLRESPRYINADVLGIRDEFWKNIKHQFRVSGGKRTLPVLPDARPFLQSLHGRNLQIVLLTSRPIDRYPNIYTDTLLWLQENELPFDFVWWSLDKAERVLEGDLRQYVKMVVDDDMKYLRPFLDLGLQCYHVDRYNDPVTRAATTSPLLHPVTSLREVIVHLDNTIREHEARSWDSIETHNTRPTPPSPENGPRPISAEVPNPSV